MHAHRIDFFIFNWMYSFTDVILSIFDLHSQKSREHVENIVFSYKSEDEDDSTSLPLPGPDFPQQNIYQVGCITNNYIASILELNLYPSIPWGHNHWRDGSD